MGGSYIAISGMICSGKTTLAKKLANYIGWDLLPESIRSIDYLSDLFSDQERWAFDTQVSFLCEKAIKLKKKLESRKNIVLDRSIYEDINIFAKYFFDNKKIDERSFRTYRELSDYFLADLPSTSLLVYCDCSYDVIEKRLHKRNRSKDLLYPEGFLNSIFQRYHYWIKNFYNVPICNIDSEKNDFRNNNTIKRIGDEIVYLLTKQTCEQKQLRFPGFDSGENAIEKNEIIRVVSVPMKPLSQREFNIKASFKSSYPLVYIAAPFTSATTQDKNKTGISPSSFLEIEAPHGKILKGSYRKTLNSISRTMKRIGFDVVLPHRDVNVWGEKILSPEEVFDLCTKHVKESDLFIGLLGLSHGSHYEFGLAVADNKPIILISAADTDESFIAKGVGNKRDNILILKTDFFDDSPELLKSPGVRSFLNKFFYIEG